MRRSVSLFLAFGLVSTGLLLWSGCGLNSEHANCEHDHNHDHANAVDGPKAGLASDLSGPQPSTLDPQPSDGHTHIGPNGRRLIVLGEDEYHADLAIDQTDGSATVVLLDRTARRPLPIQQDQITLNLIVNGCPHQLRLVASPQPTDPTGSASKFIGQNPILIEPQKLRGRLSLVIAGKPYTGPIAHLEDGQRALR